METAETKTPKSLHHDTLVLCALDLLAEEPACLLSLGDAICAATVAVALALKGGDVREVAEDLTAWCVDDEDAELIERCAAFVRGKLSAGRYCVSETEEE